MSRGVWAYSPYQRKQHMRQGEENIRNQESCHHVGLPVCAVQYQEVPAAEEKYINYDKSHVKLACESTLGILQSWFFFIQKKKINKMAH
jgi:hypothetical protein